jgi:hypothetical protein
MKTLMAMATLLIAVLLLSGCAATKFKETWKDPQVTHKVKRVYLVGVTRNDKMRQLFETEFVRQLAAFGVTGIPSYPDLPISGTIDREALRDRLRAQGADAVLVGRIVGKEKRTTAFSAGESGYGIGTAPIHVYYDDYYNNSVTIIGTGPAVEKDFQLFSIRANLFETESAKVVWSALTETSAGDDNRAQRLREYVEIIVKTLKDDGLL